MPEDDSARSYDSEDADYSESVSVLAERGDWRRLRALMHDFAPDLTRNEITARLREYV